MNIRVKDGKRIVSLEQGELSRLLSAHDTVNALAQEVTDCVAVTNSCKVISEGLQYLIDRYDRSKDKKPAKGTA